MNKLKRMALISLSALFGWNCVQAEIITYPVPMGIYYARHHVVFTV